MEPFKDGDDLDQVQPADSMKSGEHSIGGPLLERGKACSLVLRALPEWFGIEDDIVNYEREIDKLPTWCVHDRDHLIGFLSLKQHSAYAAEVYVMGLLEEWQHKGIGRALLSHAQDWLKDKGFEYLQVKTLAPSREDAHYARTRAFYEAMGFRALEELKQIWDENNPCLIMVKRL
jgi:GNAT superfamily N-acetyltransferase